MTILSEDTIHIHSSPGLVCAACGDVDDGTRAFVLNVGYWNSLDDRCSPSTIIRPSDYTISGRQEPRTSALLGERLPNRKRTDDMR